MTRANPGDAPVARLAGVSLRYGKTLALDAVNLEVPAGCMVGLIGPDGVGKSSLLALISGARAVQQGEVEVLGGDMRAARHRNQVCPSIAYMPQGLGKNLYPALSVEDNLQFFGRLFGHSVYRALLLVALGIFLRSQARPQTYFTFEDVLTQIGLGYVFLFLLAWTRPAVQWAAAAVILVGYWAAFALYPLPPAGFDTTLVGVPANWPHHLTGFAAHWDKNTNLANAFDQWFLNLFPRERPFVFTNLRTGEGVDAVLDRRPVEPGLHVRGAQVHE